MVREELVQIVENVWLATVGDALRVAASDASGANRDTGLVASIQFKGAWDGVLTATVSTALARTLASTMFGLPAEESSENDIRDAVGEIINILGGNVKALLPSPCQLSLPSVFDDKHVPSHLIGVDAAIVDTVSFDWRGETMVVSLARDDSHHVSTLHRMPGA